MLFSSAATLHFFFFFFCVWYSLHIQNSTICCVHKIRIERSGQKMAIADTNIQHKSTFMIVNGFVLAKWRLIDNYYQKPNKSWFFIFHFGSIQQCFALYTKLKIAHLKALPSIIWFSLLVFSALFSLCWYLSLFPIYALYASFRQPLGIPKIMHKFSSYDFSCKRTTATVTTTPMWEIRFRV